MPKQNHAFIISLFTIIIDIILHSAVHISSDVTV